MARFPADAYWHLVDRLAELAGRSIETRTLVAGYLNAQEDDDKALSTYVSGYLSAAQRRFTAGYLRRAMALLGKAEAVGLVERYRAAHGEVGYRWADWASRQGGEHQ